MGPDGSNASVETHTEVILNVRVEAADDLAEGLLMDPIWGSLPLVIL